MKRTSVVKLAVIGVVAILLPALVRASDSPASSSSFEIKMPLGIPIDLWTYFVPNDNPITAVKVELGRKLFFDARLSADGKVSCGSCHDPKRAFTDGRKVAEGIGGRLGARNSPTLLNSMFSTGQFWDGRAGTLEEQARMPLTNMDEMGNRSLDEVVTKIAVVPEYVRGFQQVFGGPVTIDGFAKAVAAFERTLVSADSPLDRYLAGDLNALSEPARNGLILFRTKARCGICHVFNQNFAAFATFPFFTDGNYRNTGVAVNFSGFNALARRAMAATRDESGDAMAALSKHERAGELGRFVTTGNALDVGAFRTPSLRNVELTAPYFHDGSAATLSDVVRFYVKGGNENPNRDWQLEPVMLTESEQHDLVEFLKALTSDDARRMVGAR
ncbi:MAG TPA: cytochrome c peroxidase [Blastocatellia bacterium]|nr:cytochrome c peroxidase [Blastocatellia bacterium]